MILSLAVRLPVDVSLARLRLPRVRHCSEPLSQLRQTSVSVRKLTGDFLEMSQEVRGLFTHLSEERFDLAETPTAVLRWRR